MTDHCRTCKYFRPADRSYCRVTHIYEPRHPSDWCGEYVADPENADVIRARQESNAQNETTDGMPTAEIVP